MSHTLSRRTHVRLNGIDTDALHRTADAVRDDPSQGRARFGARSRWMGQTRSVATLTDLELGGQRAERGFMIAADEPAQLLGSDTAPNPQELLLAALNACLIVGLVANAAARGIVIERLEVQAEGELDLRGFLGLDPDVRPGYQTLHCTVTLQTQASAEAVRALHEHVWRTSPNVSNLAGAVRLVPQLRVHAG